MAPGFGRVGLAAAVPTDPSRSGATGEGARAGAEVCTWEVAGFSGGNE